MRAIERIRTAHGALKDDLLKPWVKLDRLPYIHATDNPNAKPYSTPVVGRFDYMESADYILSCNPSAMSEVLTHIDKLEKLAEERLQNCAALIAENERLRTESEERLQNCAALVAEVERLRAEVTRPESTDMTLMRALVQSQATELERLRKDAERYRWIKSAKGLTLESERGGPWTRENGGTFTPSHRLCAGGTQFAPYETLDDAIDTAMKGTP
jgi:hypothetical protein